MGTLGSDSCGIACPDLLFIRRAPGYLQHPAEELQGFHLPLEAVPVGRRMEGKRREPGPAWSLEYSLGREDWASGASKCQTLPKQSKFVLYKVGVCL